MANDIDKTSPHYKGDFGSIYEVNKKFPTGGVAGDFVVIEGWAHYWNADRGTWCVNAERDSYWDELITNIIEKFKLVRGATYMGVASLNTVPAKVIGAKLYYFATEAGTYKNFGDLIVPQGINVLYSENGSSWVNTSLLEVAQELGVSTKKVVSQKVLNDAFLKKFDKENIVQESGDSEDKVMSQKAVSDKLSSLAEKTEIKNEEGKTIKTPFREIESPEFLHCIVDAEDRFLFGILLDGSIEWGKGIPAPIRTKLQEIITQCQQDKTDLLGSINTINGILDKTTIKDEAGEIQDTPFRVIENEEFIMAVVDSEDRVLFGIYRATGKPYFPLNDMYHVEQNEEFFAVWLDAADHVLLGIRRDGQIIGEIHAVGALKQVVFALQEKIDTIDSSLKEILDVFSSQENPEYLAVEQDAEGKVLSATNADGSHYIHNAKSETIPTEFSHIEDPEGRTEITTDTEGKVMSYRDSEGKMHEHDMEVTNLEVSNLNLQANSVSDIKTALIEDGFEVKTPIDWSDYSTNDGKYPLHLQEPRCAFLNIMTDIELQNLNKKGLSGAEQGKNYDVPCWIEFWDKQGNYFKKTAKISGQGNSSMMFPQKNIAIDMFDTETMDSAFSVKFGNWVSQDSYHLKAFYGDFIKGIGIVAYKIAMQAQKTRGVFKDVSWKSALIDERNQSSNPLHNTVSDLNMRMSEARCMPDGFPVMLYRNGEFYGIYAMCLKKHRNNYHMNKSTPEHVHLDGIISNSTILGGSVDWTQFEIRNPKGLYYKELHQGKLSYDSDYPGCFEIADEETVNTWIENGKLPDGTAINAKIQKQLKITAKVHKYVTELSSAYGKVDTVSGIEEKKVEFNKYFDADNLIDYLLINMALADGDGFGPNWQWTTWDGTKWYVNQYDKDNTCGYDSKAFFVHDIRNPMSWYGANVSIMKFVQSNYSEELKLRWKELVNAQILTKENIMNEIMKWTERIGYNNYDRHYNEKWTESPCSRDPAVSVNWKLESIVYSSDEGNYSNTSVYNTGDKCTIAQEMFLITFKCVKDGTVGVFPCKVYNFRPKYLGFYDSMWRLEKFISENLQAVNDFINKL